MQQPLLVECQILAEVLKFVCTLCSTVTVKESVKLYSSLLRWLPFYHLYENAHSRGQFFRSSSQEDFLQIPVKSAH